MYFDLIFLYIFLSLTISEFNSKASYCFSEDDQPNMHYGLATSYSNAKARLHPSNPIDCQIKGIWMLIRHGSNNPKEEDLRMFEDIQEIKDSIIYNHRSRRKGSLCEKDIEGLESWYPSLEVSKENFLSRVGYNEATDLANDLFYLYEDVFNSTNPATIAYAHSSNFLAKQTAKAVLETLTSLGTTAKIVNLGDYPALCLDHSCPNWRENERKKILAKESKEYKSQMEVRDTLRQISIRLGFAYDLHYEDIYKMYKLCSYETAQFLDKLSPWCAVFDKTHTQIFQNEQDLYTYYTVGYGNSISPKLGCPTVRNLFQTFSDLSSETNSDDTVQVTLLFGEDVNLMTVLTTLGIAWDAVPITARNIDKKPNRMWNTSQISPYLSNLFIVLYKCSDEYKIKFLLNNYIINYIGCNSTYCSWNYVQEEFEDMLDPLSCNFDFCVTTVVNYSPLFLQSKMLQAIVILYQLKHLHFY